ncbi:hypothetical protein [Streptomyces sp. NPDC015125]|uniref:hypothetical protein n=1 Tax=Streptomyces sp. NPDC015125 TaxID=3364938 RepID=UPI0036F76973
MPSASRGFPEIGAGSLVAGALGGTAPIADALLRRQPEEAHRGGSSCGGGYLAAEADPTAGAAAAAAVEGPGTC